MQGNLTTSPGGLRPRGLEALGCWQLRAAAKLARSGRAGSRQGYLQKFRVTHVTANEVDTALGAPSSEVGQRLLALMEDQWFDRKSVKVTAKDLGVPLTAFANAEG